tara:strand:+ start:149997 stop:150437 length:441 start_codon:yes stop_codon:yes gene_type:complete
MKSVIFVIAAIFGIQSMAKAQNDKILGIWYNEKKDAKIKVYKKGDAYYGKIIWLKNNKNDDGTSPKVDSKNPDSKLRKRTIVGTNIMIALKWDESEKEYNEGEIYDPRGGSTYSLFAVLKDDKTLFLKGYIGFSIFGRSTIWTKAN